jgi:glycosyltransferase involved in cell wall biosynthesis
MSKKISVIIPVYNTADYLQDCFSSVAGQSYSDFEVIVIDDGSSDNSPAICDEWQARDQRFKVYHQKNSGQAAARNYGIDVASGDYLAFIDSDDYVSADYLEQLYGALERNNADIVLCAYIEHRKDEDVILGPDEDCRLNRQQALEKLIEDDTFKSLCCARMFKKELFSGIRFPVGRNYEDLATNYKLFDKSETICAITKPLYHYQIREGSMSYNNATAAGWHVKCHSNMTSQIERTEYFRAKQEFDLADRSFAASVPYIYSDIMTGCQVGNEEDVKECRDYLKNNKKSIKDNSYISLKDKLLYRVYCSNNIAFRLLKNSKG